MASNDESKRVATTRPASRRGKTKSQIRSERRQRSQSRKKRRRTFYIAGGSVLAVVFILSLTLSPGLGGSGATHTGEGGNINFGGPVPIDTDDGRLHIPVGQRGTGYSVIPPTSGPHWIGPDAWTLSNGEEVDAPADWGIYDVPLPNEVLIHNLEHGGIGLHYNCPEGCDAIVEALEDFVPRSRAQFILAPYPNMEPTIAITAWRHHLHLEEIDEEQILDFIDAYQDRAPESVPSNLYP